MAQFKPAFDIWKVDQEARQRIQPGQWVFAGDPSCKGRFYGSNGRVDVVAWLGNARARRRDGGVPSYFAAIRCYARGLSRYGVE
jgi:hypothetical protein